MRPDGSHILANPHPLPAAIVAKALTDLAAAGIAVWLDDLSRSCVHSGSLARSVEAGDIVGITTNPTILA